MADIIVVIWAWVIAIGFCSIILAPLMGLCYHFTKIKIKCLNITQKF